MSFDSEFDYTPAINYYNGRITELSLERDDANTQIATFITLPSQYDNLKIHLQDQLP